MKKLLSRPDFVRYFYPLFRRLGSTLLAADTVMQQNRHSVAAEVYRRKKGVGVGDELRNRRIAATILSDYKENGGTRP